MKCQNCGENNANVRYTQIINGEKKEFILCEACAEKLGIKSKLNFDMNMDFGSFFGDFFEEYKPSHSLLGEYQNNNILKCKKCGMTYEEFVNKGKFGCDACYEVFSDKIDNVLKNMQGANIHTGRRARKSEKKLNVKPKSIENKTDKNTSLKDELNKAIREERYEDAAKLRDKIKKIEKEDK